jgi:ADP-L-glycero-D-manno-heptose 6-epimerase
MQSVVAKIWPSVSSGDRVQLFRSHRAGVEDGGQMRDFVYVADVADCVSWLARSPEVSGLFNLGSGKARSFADLARATFAAAGREPRIDYVDMPASMRGAYQYFTEARMDGLRQAGWTQAPMELEDGVGDYVLRFLSRDDPYR